MLGLGSGLTTPSGSYNLVKSYQSSFSGSGLEGWEPFSVEDSASDLTMTSNVDGFDSQDNWLKIEYGVTQTSSSGITNPLSGLGNYEKGDLVELKLLSAHFVDDSNKWGSSGSVQLAINIGGANTVNASSVAIGTSSSIKPAVFVGGVEVDYGSTFTFAIGNDSTDVSLTLSFNNALSFPQAGAVFYIKDIELKVYRLNG